MSSSSEDLLLIGLLDGLSAECATMAGEIDRLADFACEHVPMTDAGVVTLQAFDPLAQNARAQARLLAGIAALLRTGRVAQVSGLVDEHPIPSARRRLRAVLSTDLDIAS